MNIRFLAQSEYFNGLHIKDDIVLEKEYEQGPFTNLPKVRYYLYYLEENVRKEVMPFSDKVDVFNITNCQNESEYLYFTEYSDMHDGTYVFSIVRYNITDHTHTKIISLKDNINLYPDNKQMVEEFAQNIAMQGISFDQYMQFTGTTVDQLTEHVKPQAEARVQSSLVLEAIVKAEKIEASYE